MTRHKILAVDSDSVITDLISQWLTFDGYVATAANGREGLEKVRSFEPDLIMTDIKMPVMDGYEFCQEVTGITDAAEQAAKEGEFVAAKVSHLVSESLDVGISVGMEDGGNSTLTTSRVTAPCWLILSSVYLIRTWMWTRAAAL